MISSINAYYMHFLNDYTAHIIQFISLFLEVIGFFLALVEFKFKRLKKKIESIIRYFVILSAHTRKKDILIVNILYLLIGIILFIFLVFYPMQLEMHVLIVFILYVILIAIVYVFALVDKISKSTKIGALGLILASFGILGEFYQLLQLFIH